MKLRRPLEVTIDEFYDQLEEELIAEVKKHSGKTITAKDITKGMKYTTKAKDDVNFASTTITVLGYERGNYYKCKTTSVNDTIHIEYYTKPDKKGIEITFVQNIDSFDEKKHNKFMAAFSKAVYLGRMSDALYDIQKKVHKKREEAEEK